MFNILYVLIIDKNICNILIYFLTSMDETVCFLAMFADQKTASNNDFVPVCLLFVERLSKEGACRNNLVETC